ncbi:MAG: DUF1214 domain-containing protein [Acidimicrobiia bacterium]|nr:DUF1214 domain-containing protein [Acidimicrobiia bacterium]
MEEPAPPTPHERLMSGDAWLGFCARLADLGERLLTDDFPAGERARAEGYRHLTRLLVFALRMELEFSDPVHPVFFRFEDPWTQWGGPNADNIYLRATIDPTLTYRVWLDTTGVRQLLVSLSEGDMQLDEYGVYSERALDELEVDDDGRLELVISPDEQPGNWVPSHPDARLVTIRQYQADWEHDRVAVAHIERVGGEGVPPPPPDPDWIGDGLDRAAQWVERSLVYWNNYLSHALDGATPNEMSKPRTPAGGAENIAYGSGFWDLTDDQVLLITCDVPDADYWNFQIHTMGWFESGDFAHRQTSLNGAQAHVDDDGRVRLVVAHHDPGVPNWIDTEQRPVGLLAYRWVRARSLPVPEAELVPVDELAAHLPADHPRIDAEARRQGLRRRREAVLSRYR